MEKKIVPSTLVLIETDPRTSARPAEGVRMAAGIGAWRKTEVTLVLRGPAGFSLQEYPDELRDEDNFSRYLPVLSETGRPIYVEDSFTDFAALERSIYPYQIIRPQETAGLILRHNFLIRL